MAYDSPFPALARRLLAPGGAAGVLAVLAIPAAFLLLPWPSLAGEAAVRIPPPALDSAPTEVPAGRTPALETAVLAGGCFWGVQGVFQHTRGVVQVLSGYDGGPADAASYERVGTGRTGHAESVQITFDPRQISYGRLLQVYFSVVHDPTQLNRQGPDSGTQYRSAIFYSTPRQKDIAEHYVAQLNAAGVFRAPIATQITANTGFYPAEGYHQDYLTLHPDAAYIIYNDLPKVANLKALFPALYQETPVLVTARAEAR